MLNFDQPKVGSRTRCGLHNLPSWQMLGGTSIPYDPRSLLPSGVIYVRSSPSAIQFQSSLMAGPDADSNPSQLQKGIQKTDGARLGNQTPDGCFRWQEIERFRRRGGDVQVRDVQCVWPRRKQAHPSLGHLVASNGHWVCGARLNEEPQGYPLPLLLKESKTNAGNGNGGGGACSIFSSRCKTGLFFAT